VLGVVTISAVLAAVVTVTGDESGGLIELPDVDGEEQLATERPAATRRASRQIATPAT